MGSTFYNFLKSFQYLLAYQSGENWLSGLESKLLHTMTKWKHSSIVGVFKQYIPHLSDSTTPDLPH